MAWQIDPNHSHIEFSARHMMISTVRGTFERFSGTVDYDEADPTYSSVDIQIDANSINTRVEQRDNHLRSADFLYAEKYPTLTFKSKRAEQLGENQGRLIGDLTIRDITQEVVLEVERLGKMSTPWGTTSVGFNGRAKINRKDWNLNWNQILEAGALLAGEEITINIDLELMQQAAAQPQEAVAA